jgi:hypothetical protein
LNKPIHIPNVTVMPAINPSIKSMLISLTYF